ncbi:MAG: hypothetical protein LBN26_07575 [Christensenellaceae bacterium]|nr:hypothetical protein [Christensenellaceae bacterium]
MEKKNTAREAVYPSGRTEWRIKTAASRVGGVGMTWADIFKVVIAFIGGAGVIIAAVIKFSSDKIAERLSAKYELRLNKELESFKSGLEKKNYVSKVRFDAEFEIYRQLSKTFFDMVKSIHAMIPPGLSRKLADKPAQKEEDERVYSNASRDIVTAQDLLHASDPFIPEDFYNLYDEILKLGYLQLNAFNPRWDNNCLAAQEEKERLTPNDYNRSSEMNNKLMLLNNRIRDYLSKLDVINE